MLIPLLFVSLFSVSSVSAQTTSVIPTIYCVGGSGIPPCAAFPSTEPSTAPSVAVNPSITTLSPIPSSGTSLSPSVTVDPCNTGTSANNVHRENQKSGGFFGNFFQKISQLLQQLLGGKPAPVTASPSTVPSTIPSQVPSGSPSVVPSVNPCASAIPVQSTTPSQSPSAVPSSSPVPSVSPCATGTSSVSSSNAKQHRKWGRRGGGDDRRGGGFFEVFFKWLLQLIELLLGGAGGGGQAPTPTPCPGTSTAPSVVPGVSTIPSTQPSAGVSSAPITTLIPSTAPSSTPITTIPIKSAASNWAGYVSQTTIPTNAKITANWTVPTNDCTLGDGTTSPWPGMGGSSSSDPNIAQLGNDDDCTGGVATYPAWSEAYPANSVYYQNAMSAGDQMTASVTFTGNGAFTTTMTNTTKGWTLNVPMSFSGYTPTSSEVIMEALGNGQVPKFTNMNFTNAIYSPDGTQQVPFASAPSMVGLNGGTNSTIKIQTNALSGSSFSESWVSY